MPKTRRDRAEELLGLSRPYTADDVAAAFKARVHEAHPDTGGSGADVAALRTARDLAMTYAGVLKSECEACKGTGWVRSVGFAAKKCRQCKYSVNRRGL